MNTSKTKLSPKALNIRPNAVTKLLLLIVLTGAAAVPALAVDRTWTGLGATNNWSEAANWSDNSIPGVNDRAIFNATSTKNATIDTNFSVQGILIEAGYTGTISQGSSNLIVGTGSYSQAGGTFTAGSGVLDFNGAFTLSGGTFTAPAGPVTFAANFTVSEPGVFVPNGGTVVFDSASLTTLNLPASFTLANLTIHKSHTVQVSFGTTTTITVTGALSLTDGIISGVNGTIEALGAVNIASTFDGGAATLLISGTATRTVTLPVGAALPRLVVNAPNVTMNTSGMGTITFAQPIVVQNVSSFTNGAVNFTHTSSFVQSGGIFTAGSGVLGFNGAFTLSGGTFTAPVGPVTFASHFTVSDPGVFDPNGGTVVFVPSIFGAVNLNLPASFTLANLTINKSNNVQMSFGTTSTIVVTGALSLTDGAIGNTGAGNGTIEALGAVNIASTFDGGAATLLISGTATPRTVTLPVGAALPRLVVNAPNVTMNTSGTGTITFAREIVVQNVSSFTNGAVNFVFSVAFTVGAGTIFVPDSGNLTFNSTFTQTAGTFTAGSGTIAFNGAFTLSGGTFTAPAGTVTFASHFTVSGAGVFDPNGGTVVFVGGAANLNLPASFTLANLTINKSHNVSVSFSTTSTIVVTGALTLTDGRVSNPGGVTGTIEALGAVSVASTYDSGNSNIRFGGTADQTYSNGGGVNQTGTWTIDKPAGSIFLLTDLNLSNGGAAAFNLTNGTVTTNGFVVNAGTRVINRTNGYVNGNLRRTINSVASRIFDVGTENGFSPVTANVTAFVNPSALTIGAVQGQHPNRPLTGSALSRYWELTEEGDLTAILTFSYLESDMSVDESSFNLFRYSGSGTLFDQIPATLDTDANTITTQFGQTVFGDFTMLSPIGPTSAGAVVEGRVVTQEGRPVRMARLSLADMDGNVRGTLTNPWGNFRFDGVSTGATYVLSVGHKSYEFTDPTRLITVSEDISDIVFTTIDPVVHGSEGTISGVVRDQEGNLIPDLVIEILGGPTGTPIFVTTGKSGEFEAVGLPVGRTYVLTALSDQLIFEIPTIVVILDDVSVEVEFRVMGSIIGEPRKLPDLPQSDKEKRGQP
jgi:hypothetical protein